MRRGVSEDTHPGMDTAEERMSPDTHPRDGNTTEPWDASGYSSRGGDTAEKRIS